MSTRFTALTIREGDAFLLEDNGWKCLFDSGDDEIIVDLLKYKGIDKLDLAICSHNDADHAKGFIELLQLDSGIKIDEIWLPGLWASILQFVRDNCIERKEIHCSEEDYIGELGSLYSGESVSLELFNKTLSFFAEWKDYRDYDFHNRFADKIAKNPTTLARYMVHYLVYNLPHFLNDDLCQSKIEDHLYEYLDDIFEGFDGWIKRDIVVLLASYPDYQLKSNSSLISDLESYFEKEICDNPYRKHAKHLFENSLDFKLERIMKIASLAYQRGCKIRFFEPTTDGNNIRFIDYGFVAFNSNEIFHVKKLENSLMYLYALNLTKENKYSMVFEYVKNDIPVIRFSADSKSTCQSVSPYPENIIVTAPHHGSKANANVYESIQGDDIIWVRSDSLYGQGRPCDTFKLMKNKYCLACKKYHFISEVCFEYNPTLKLWSYVHGERCRCKP